MIIVLVNEYIESKDNKFQLTICSVFIYLNFYIYIAHKVLGHVGARVDRTA